LTDFLENISLVSDQDSLPETSENVVLSSNGAVNIMTLHAAKGLEYPYVFIVGLDEGILPHKFSIKDEEEVAEERRLFYVGLTRAKKQIYLCRAVRRPSYMIEENPSSTSFGTNGYSQSTPSCFLSEINENLIIKQGLRNTGLHNSAFRNDYQDDFRWSTTGVTRKVTQTVTPSFKEPKFKPGMKVRKPDRADWGEGIVLGSKVESDGEETVEIHFSSIGLKRLLASLANLEILN
jgi:DNA helicase-2/ATP-dependent DNA helicase PcrA